MDFGNLVDGLNGDDFDAEVEFTDLCRKNPVLARHAFEQTYRPVVTKVLEQSRAILAKRPNDLRKLLPASKIADDLVNHYIKVTGSFNRSWHKVTLSKKTKAGDRIPLRTTLESILRMSVWNLVVR